MGRKSYPGAEFLLSMVETHWSPGNGDARKMEVRLKAEQELAKIEQQIEHLAGGAGAERRNHAGRSSSCMNASKRLRRQIHSGL